MVVMVLARFFVKKKGRRLSSRVKHLGPNFFESGGLASNVCEESFFMSFGGPFCMN
jgi:hypothetical protein